MVGLGASLALLAGCSTTQTGSSQDDGTTEPAAEDEVAQWLHNLSTQYEERADVLSTASAPAGGSSAIEFDGQATVDSMELYCFGEENVTVQVDFATTDAPGSIEVELTCAEGMHEVILEETGVDHSAVTEIDVRSSPPSDGRHYAVALGTMN